MHAYPGEDAAHSPAQLRKPARLAFPPHTQSATKFNSMSSNTALLVVDAQVNMFGESFPIYQGDRLLEHLKQLIQRARNHGVLVVYLQNNGEKGEPDEPGTSGWEIHPSLRPKDGDLVVQKFEPSAFANTDLHMELQCRGIERLFVIGMQTEVCIRANSLSASDLKYDVILVRDVHSTFATERATAAQIIEEVNAELSGIIKVKAASEITFE